MDTEKVVLDDRDEGHPSEGLTESVKDRVRVFQSQLLLEAIAFRNLADLVISSEESELTGMFEEEGKQEHNAFKREGTTVDIVAQEEVVFEKRVGAEDADEIEEASVDVANDTDGAIDANEDGLGTEMLASERAEQDNLRMRELGEWNRFTNRRDLEIRGSENCVEAGIEAVDEVERRVGGIHHQAGM
jgi:hypothetical protein